MPPHQVRTISRRPPPRASAARPSSDKRWSLLSAGAHDRHTTGTPQAHQMHILKAFEIANSGACMICREEHSRRTWEEESPSVLCPPSPLSPLSSVPSLFYPPFRCPLSPLPSLSPHNYLQAKKREADRGGPPAGRSSQRLPGWREEGTLQRMRLKGCTEGRTERQRMTTSRAPLQGIPVVVLYCTML